MVTTLTKGNIAGDVIKYFLTEEYSMEEFVLHNAGLADYTDFDIGGRPVDLTTVAGKATLVEGGKEADASGIVATKGHIDSLAAAADTPKKYAILRRIGVVWESGMHVLDPAGAAIVPADVGAALNAIAGGIVSKTGGTTQGSTQTT